MKNRINSSYIHLKLNLLHVSSLQNLTRDSTIVQELMNEVLQVYAGLAGVAPLRAEIQYMREIQMMDGYGMEYYVAKVGNAEK